MGNSQAGKAASHDRIVKAAAARMRRDGINGVGVSDLMNEAGLTHGGFYRHFDSRDDLVAEAVECGLAQGSEHALALARRGGMPALNAFIDAYLSESHRDSPETGCAVVALAEDVARAGSRPRSAYARQVGDYIDVLAGLLPGADPVADRQRATLILSALVGAVSMARAVDDVELSRQILDQTATALKAEIRGLVQPDVGPTPMTE